MERARRFRRKSRRTRFAKRSESFGRLMRDGRAMPCRERRRLQGKMVAAAENSARICSNWSAIRRASLSPALLQTTKCALRTSTQPSFGSPAPKAQRKGSSMATAATPNTRRNPLVIDLHVNAARRTCQAQTKSGAAYRPQAFLNQSRYPGTDPAHTIRSGDTGTGGTAQPKFTSCPKYCYYHKSVKG